MVLGLASLVVLGPSTTTQTLMTRIALCSLSLCCKSNGALASDMPGQSGSPKVDEPSRHIMMPTNSVVSIVNKYVRAYKVDVIAEQAIWQLFFPQSRMCIINNIYCLGTFFPARLAQPSSVSSPDSISVGTIYPLNTSTGPTTYHVHIDLGRQREMTVFVLFLEEPFVAAPDDMLGVALYIPSQKDAKIRVYGKYLELLKSLLELVDPAEDDNSDAVSDYIESYKQSPITMQEIKHRLKQAGALGIPRLPNYFVVFRACQQEFIRIFWTILENLLLELVADGYVHSSLLEEEEFFKKCVKRRLRNFYPSALFKCAICPHNHKNHRHPQANRDDGTAPCKARSVLFQDGQIIFKTYCIRGDQWMVLLDVSRVDDPRHLLNALSYNALTTKCFSMQMSSQPGRVYKDGMLDVSGGNEFVLQGLPLDLLLRSGDDEFKARLAPVHVVSPTDIAMLECQKAIESHLRGALHKQLYFLDSHLNPHFSISSRIIELDLQTHTLVALPYIVLPPSTLLFIHKSPKSETIRGLSCDAWCFVRGRGRRVVFFGITPKEADEDRQVINCDYVRL